MAMSPRVAFEERAGAGPPVVFLHGLGGDAACWRPQLEALGGRYRAIAWDMPGYGGSERLEAMTLPALAAALAALLDRLGIERTHLVGHSMGGMVAQELAATQPERLRSLTLSATSAAFGSADGAWQQAFVAERLAPLDRGLTLAELAPDLLRGLLGPDPDPDGVRQATASMARVPEATYRAAVRCLITFDRRAALEAITAPTLLLAGECDPVAPPAMMARMAARIPGARCVVLPGAGHLANLERPATFNEALAGFLVDVEREGLA
jgi:3-oxoadipate enol-lactonase